MRKRFCFSVIGVFIIVGCSSISNENESIYIVKDGKSDTVIITRADTDTEMRVAKELQRYIKRISSSELPILSYRTLPLDKRQIIISSRLYPEFAPEAAKITDQGFAIKALQGGNVVIAANGEKGLWNGCYYFLKKYCGVRWFFPGELGTVIPCLQTLKIPKMEDIQNPDFKERFTAFGSATDKAWRRCNLLGSEMKCFGGHSFCLHVPAEKYFKEHPEYYALVKGVRKRPEYLDNSKARNWGEWQLCTSNPEVVNIVAASVCKIFKEKPDVRVADISPNDGDGWCECADCKALDKKPGVLSDRIMRFANEVAEKVAEKYPDHYLRILAYQEYIKPPENMKIHPNIIVLYAYSAADSYRKNFNDEQLSFIKGWAECAKNIWIYEYFVSECWSHFTPRIIPHAIDRELKYFKTLSVVNGYEPQFTNDWAVNGINYYVASQLLWDSSLDVDNVIDDYCEKLFEQSAKEMKEYFACFENAWAKGMGQAGAPGWMSHFPDRKALEIYNDDMLAYASVRIEAAMAKANSDTVRKRIAMFNTALTFTKNHVAILKVFEKLRETGITIDDYGIKPSAGNIADPEKIKKLLVDASGAIEIQLGFLDSQKNSLTIGYEWAHDPGTRPMRYIPIKKRQLSLIKRYISMYSSDSDNCMLPDIWEFRIDRENKGISAKWFENEWPESETDNLSILTFWNKQKDAYKNYEGVGWYRTEIKIPSSFEGRRIIISFGGVDAEARVYINGKLAGHHPYSKSGNSWRENFEFDISGLVKVGETNEITVWVDGHGQMGGIWQPVVLYSLVSEIVGNGTFDAGMNSWAWHPGAGKAVSRPEIVPSGKGGGNCIMFGTPGQVTQKIYLKPHSKYKISGWIKTENMTKGAVADIYLAPSPGVMLFSMDKNSDWIKFEKYFDTDRFDALLTLRLIGGAGSAYFDQIKIQPIDENMKDGAEKK